MLRNRLKDLENWKDKKDHKPLLLRGARQTGKTWLARELGKKFTHFCEINLEANPEFIPVFEESYGKPEILLREISALTAKKIIPGETLLFIDEIQESPDAVIALRYFYEKMPKLHVLGAGSLLEFTLKEISFPVGRVDFLYLFPMNFNEYLLATGREDLALEIKNLNKALPSAIHDLLMKEIAIYTLLGGMPAVIKCYIETKDFQECQNIQQSLLATFRTDFNKYASRASLPYVRMLFDSIPRLFSKKFKYSEVSHEVRSRDLSAALDLIIEAGLAYRVHHSSCNGIPLSSEMNIKKFKVFFLDSGLAYRVLGLKLNELILEKNFLVNRGGTAEQLVCQEILSKTSFNEVPMIHYWSRDEKSSQAEVDFVITSNQSIIPIEVKSGLRGRLRSLQIFMSEKNKDFAIVISKENFSFIKKKHKILNLPFYAVMHAFD